MRELDETKDKRLWQRRTDKRDLEVQHGAALERGELRSVRSARGGRAHMPCHSGANQGRCASLGRDPDR